jgi:hypothetical protein
MPELGPFGSVRGVAGNGHPYRDNRPVPDIGRGRKRPSNPTEADVEITLEMINADPIFSVPLRQ